MYLPRYKDLPIQKLSGVFNNTTASYKFYWFLAIIENIEEGSRGIDKKDIFIKMISNSWYTIKYFNLSFGLQDYLQTAINEISIIENIQLSEEKNKIEKKLKLSKNIDTIRILNHFNNNVPHWFLSPWYPSTSKSEIYRLSQENYNNPIYSIEKEIITINENWFEYLTINSRIIKDFIYWNLATFLQKKNPTVPDIPNKLIKPIVRESLNKQRKFWELVLKYDDSLTCIYTGEKIIFNNFDVEHYIPYNFVSHNQIWNLIPSQKEFNIQKSNKLPLMNLYFERFYETQNKAINIYLAHNPKEKLLQEYYNIGIDIHDGFSKEKFFNVINPLIAIAHNNGFQFL